MCLIKPQFEAGREKVGKKGVVRDASVHQEVIESVLAFASDAGFEILHLTYSPVKGPEGNIEYLVHLRKTADIGTGNTLSADIGMQDVVGFDACQAAAVVAAAHEALD